MLSHTRENRGNIWCQVVFSKVHVQGLYTVLARPWTHTQTNMRIESTHSTCNLHGYSNQSLAQNILLVLLLLLLLFHVYWKKILSNDSIWMNLWHVWYHMMPLCSRWTANGQKGQAIQKTGCQDCKWHLHQVGLGLIRWSLVSHVGFQPWQPTARKVGRNTKGGKNSTGPKTEVIPVYAVPHS